MAKALAAVSTVLVVFMAIFGAVAYFGREEDRIAVDSPLSEKFSLAIAVAEDRGELVDLRALADFDFDEVVFFAPGTPRADIDAELGFEFRGDLLYDAESSHIMVFLNREKFVRFADYRGRNVLAGLDEPFARLDANDAVFEVQDGVATPQRFR